MKSSKEDAFRNLGIQVAYIPLPRRPTPLRGVEARRLEVRLRVDAERVADELGAVGAAG